MNNKDAALLYPEIFEYIPNTGRLAVFVDNQTLSSLRKCEGYFIEWYKNRLAPRGESAWNLEFGIFWHTCMEHFYEGLKNNQSYEFPYLVKYAKERWSDMAMKERFENDYRYIQMDGFIGAAIMLTDFYDAFGKGKERLKVISTELPFGRAREVPLLDWRLSGHDSKFLNKYDLDIYLVGRPDVLVDNGRSIGPLDFKTASFKSGREHDSYKPYDALAGYVYGVNYILGEKYRAFGRQCDTAFVCVIIKDGKVKSEKRFAQLAIMYSPSELEEYRLRQISTVNRIYELLVLGETPQWNTQLCNNDWYHDCVYKPLHNMRPEHRSIIREQNYITIERWNPETRNKKEKEL